MANLSLRILLHRIASSLYFFTTVSSDVGLVVLHPKEVKKPSDQILTLPEFKKLGIIVDMSFISAKGIISNDITASAVKQMVGFINKFWIRIKMRTLITVKYCDIWIHIQFNFMWHYFNIRCNRICPIKKISFPVSL